MSDDNYEPVVAGPIEAGDQAKRNAATLWETVCAESVGHDVRNFHFWQFRRLKKRVARATA